MSARLIFAFAALAASVPANAWSTYSAPSVTAGASAIQAGVRPYIPRVEKVHLNLSLLTTCATTPCDSYYGITESIHHDGDPALLTLSESQGAGNGNVQTVVSISADRDSSGSFPNGYVLRSRSSGAIVAQYSCPSIYYCSIGFVFSPSSWGVYSNGIPAGTYDLKVSYQDGSYAMHTLVLQGIYGSGGYGETQISTPRPF